jgi:hypothetical protein
MLCDAFCGPFDLVLGLLMFVDLVFEENRDDVAGGYSDSEGER